MSGGKVSLLDQEATDWVARMDGGSLSSEDRKSFDAWLSQSDRHKGAFLRAQSLWMMFDHPRLQREEGDNEGEASSREVIAGGTTRRRVLIGTGGALAASLAGAFLITRKSGIVRTGTGELRRLPLEDGSSATINTDSELSLEFTDATRRVLLTRGEAWFSVAKNTKRPFIVDAGDVQVRAVGTAFSVYRRPEGVEVLVTEGLVDVRGDTIADPRRMKEGDRVFIPHEAKSFVVEHDAVVDRVLAWREGRIELKDEPLSGAVEQFNRYNRRQIVVLDPRLGDRTLNGLFHSDDPAGFAQAVEFALKVPVQVTDTKIFIGQ